MTFFTKLSDVTNQLNQITLLTVSGTAITLLSLTKALFALFLMFWASSIIRKILTRVLEKHAHVEEATLYLVDRLLHYLIITIAILLSLVFLGFDITHFILLASALGVGIGFGLQTIANNFISGLILLFERNLKVGDFVVLQSGTEGVIREINMRSTVINTTDNLDIIVPNAEFMNAQITNWSLHDHFVRIHIPFGVAYGSNKDIVRKAVLEAAEKLPFTVLTPQKKEPMVWLVNFGESSLDFELVVWVDTKRTLRPGMLRASYMWEIESKLREYKIEIPFPQRDIHLKSGLESLNKDKTD